MADITNTFCSQADIVARTQIKLTGTTQPNVMDVEAFAVSRAAEIQSVLLRAGFEVTPADSFSGTTEVIFRERLREANAVGAAADQWFAHFKGVTPNKSDKHSTMVKRYGMLLAELPTLVGNVRLDSAQNNPYETGEVLAPDRDDGHTAAGPPLNMRDDW